MKTRVFRASQRIPRKILNQIQFLNFRGAGEMFYALTARRQLNATVYVLLGQRQRVLSWTICFECGGEQNRQKIIEAHFYTRISERRRGYAKFLMQKLAKRYSASRFLLYDDAAYIGSKTPHMQDLIC